MDGSKDKIIANLTRRLGEQAAYIQRLELKLAEIAADKSLFMSISQLAEIVTRKTNFPLLELKSDRRDKAAVTVRFILIYLACRYTRLSTPRIGKFLNRDHTSIMHGRDKMAERLALEPLLKDLVDEIVSEVEQALQGSSPLVDANGGTFDQPIHSASIHP